MGFDIIIIGSVGKTTIYSQEDIRLALSQESTDLKHGETFTGRPGTKIYINDDTVVKIRTEIKLDFRSMQLWIEKTLEKEQQYQIHHPHKTWFIISDVENKTMPFLIGNITPRIQPLHVLLIQKEVAKEDIVKFLTYLDKLFHLYYRIAQSFKLRLDEGLSNFGVTKQGEVYYLDDDLYQWDRFISCAHMLGVYFRLLLWLREEYASQFGKNMRIAIQRYFLDVQFATVLAEQLRTVFMPAKVHQDALNLFVASLVKSQPVLIPKLLDSANRIAILSDIHANLPALQKVLEFLNTANIDAGVVLGDIVGYGPHPSECIECIQDTGFTVIKGNHDHGLATENFKTSFSHTAQWALEWSNSRVNSAQKKWLENLPSVLHSKYWMAIHGAPIDPTFFNAYVYHMTFEDNLNFMADKKIALCFHGHTHIQGIHARKNMFRDGYYCEQEIQLSDFKHILLCPGSVGQPRNRGIGTQFAIYEREQPTVYFYSLVYDIEKTTHDMENQGFPAPLIRMLNGIHP
jgi:predicted phosphodiesterase